MPHLHEKIQGLVKRYEQLDVRDAGSPSSPAISLLSGTRDEINAAIRKERPPATPGESERTRRVIGVLRGLQLDNDWLDVTLDDPPGQQVKVFEAGDTLDDVVGPMVNKRVALTVEVKRGRHALKDIELLE